MVSGKPSADRVTDMPETVYAVEVSVWRTIALGGLWISIWLCLHENNKPLFGGDSSLLQYNVAYVAWWKPWQEPQVILQTKKTSLRLS